MLPASWDCARWRANDGRGMFRCIRAAGFRLSGREEVCWGWMDECPVAQAVAVSSLRFIMNFSKLSMGQS